MVHALRNGETAVRASFQSHVAIVDLHRSFRPAVDPARLAAHNNFIDEHVFAKLGALRIEPSDLCSDAGVPPPGLPRRDRHAADADEVRAFLGRQERRTSEPG